MQMGHAPPETHGVPNLKATTTEAGQQTTGLLREALTVGACRRKSSMAQGVVSHPPLVFSSRNQLFSGLMRYVFGSESTDGEVKITRAQSTPGLG